MKKTIRAALAGLLIVPAIALGVTGAANVNAATNLDLGGGANASQGNNVPSNLTEGDDSVFKTVVNILLFVIGAVSVIMLIYGGVRYTTSGGNANSVTAAKNTIMYAIIGIVVAIFAYAIVNFVIGQLSTS